jgi:hypothetical protein
MLPESGRLDLDLGINLNFNGTSLSAQWGSEGHQFTIARAHMLDDESLTIHGLQPLWSRFVLSSSWGSQAAAQMADHPTGYARAGPCWRPVHSLRPGPLRLKRARVL